MDIYPPHTIKKIKRKDVERPLFQLYSFLTRLSPLGLRGPCSTKAPAPIDEQPGPTCRQKGKVIFIHQKTSKLFHNFHKLNQVKWTSKT